jgi:hypothetical protein
MHCSQNCVGQAYLQPIVLIEVEKLVYHVDRSYICVSAKPRTHISKQTLAVIIELIRFQKYSPVIFLSASVSTARGCDTGLIKGCIDGPPDSVSVKSMRICGCDTDYCNGAASMSLVKALAFAGLVLIFFVHKHVNKSMIVSVDERQEVLVYFLIYRRFSLI